MVLGDFKHKFSAWITAHHSGFGTFDSWYAEFGRDDFRQAVTAHRDWLWNQAYCSSKKLTKHPIWNEVLHLATVEPVPGNWVQQTVVTPYVYDCFQHMFGDKMMIVRPPAGDIREEFVGVCIPKPIRAQRDEYGNLCQDYLLDIKVGDVVATERDQGSEWKGKSTVWYAYVQGIEYQKTSRSQPHALEVIWLYAPEDTVLSKERYPYRNEVRSVSFPLNFRVAKRLIGGYSSFSLTTAIAAKRRYTSKTFLPLFLSDSSRTRASLEMSFSLDRSIAPMIQPF